MQVDKLQEAEQPAPKRGLVRSQRYTPEQWAEIERAAKKAGMQVSRYIRACALTQAREINDRGRKAQK